MNGTQQPNMPINVPSVPNMSSVPMLNGVNTTTFRDMIKNHITEIDLSNLPMYNERQIIETVSPMYNTKDSAGSLVLNNMQVALKMQTPVSPYERVAKNSAIIFVLPYNLVPDSVRINAGEEHVAIYRVAYDLQMCIDNVPFFAAIYQIYGYHWFSLIQQASILMMALYSHEREIIDLTAKTVTQCIDDNLLVQNIFINVPPLPTYVADDGSCTYASCSWDDNVQWPFISALENCLLDASIKLWYSIRTLPKIVWMTMNNKIYAQDNLPLMTREYEQIIMRHLNQRLYGFINFLPHFPENFDLFRKYIARIPLPMLMPTDAISSQADLSADTQAEHNTAPKYLQNIIDICNTNNVDIIANIMTESAIECNLPERYDNKRKIASYITISAMSQICQNRMPIMTQATYMVTRIVRRPHYHLLMHLFNNMPEIYEHNLSTISSQAMVLTESNRPYTLSLILQQGAQHITLWLVNSGISTGAQKIIWQQRIEWPFMDNENGCHFGDFMDFEWRLTRSRIHLIVRNVANGAQMFNRWLMHVDQTSNATTQNGVEISLFRAPTESTEYYASGPYSTKTLNVNEDPSARNIDAHRTLLMYADTQFTLVMLPFVVPIETLTRAHLVSDTMVDLHKQIFRGTWYVNLGTQFHPNNLIINTQCAPTDMSSILQRYNGNNGVLPDALYFLQQYHNNVLRNDFGSNNIYGNKTDAGSIYTRAASMVPALSVFPSANNDSSKNTAPLTSLLRQNQQIARKLVCSGTLQNTIPFVPDNFGFIVENAEYEDAIMEQSNWARSIRHDKRGTRMSVSHNVLTNSTLFLPFSPHSELNVCFFYLPKFVESVDSTNTPLVSTLVKGFGLSWTMLDVVTDSEHNLSHGYFALILFDLPTLNQYVVFRTKNRYEYKHVPLQISFESHETTLIFDNSFAHIYKESQELCDKINILPYSLIEVFFGEISGKSALFMCSYGCSHKHIMYPFLRTLNTQKYIAHIHAHNTSGITQWSPMCKFMFNYDKRTHSGHVGANTTTYDLIGTFIQHLFSNAIGISYNSAHNSNTTVQMAHSNTLPLMSSYI